MLRIVPDNLESITCAVLSNPMEEMILDEKWKNNHFPEENRREGIEWTLHFGQTYPSIHQVLHQSP